MKKMNLILFILIVAAVVVIVRYKIRGRAPAMANAGPNTNGSQFFIMLADYPLPRNYTIFGKVVSGQETVDNIGSEKTGANDKPLNPVIMEKVTVSKK